MRISCAIFLLAITGGISDGARADPIELAIPSEAETTPRVHIISGAPALMVWLAASSKERGIFVQPISVMDGSKGSAQNLGSPQGRLGNGSIAALGNRYVVGWEDGPAHLKEPEVLIRTVNPNDGFKIDPPIIVAQGQPEKKYTRLAAVGNSGVVISWMEEGPTVENVVYNMKPLRLMARQLDARGDLKKQIEIGGADCEGILAEPGSISILSDDEVLFTWTCLTPFGLAGLPKAWGNGWITSIRFRKLDLREMILGEEGKIEDVKQVQFGPHPDSTRLTSGVSLIVWHDEAEKVLRAQRVGKDGRKIGTVVDLIKGVSSSPEQRVFATHDEGFGVVWTDRQGSPKGIHLQQFDFHGLRVGPDVVLSESNNSIGAAELAPVNAQSLLVIWRETEVGGSSWVKGRFVGLQ